MSTKCRTCSTDNESRAIFCLECGSKLSPEFSQALQGVPYHSSIPQNKGRRRKNRWYLSREKKIVLGVVGGLAEYLGVDAGVVRLLVIIAIVITQFLPGIIIYFILGMVLPREKFG